MSDFLSDGDGSEFVVHPLSAMRRAIAARVARSWNTAPQFDVEAEADASALVQTREAARLEGGEPPPTYSDMLIHCVSRCLIRVPALNAHLEGEGLRIFKDVHIGLAVAVDDGVLLPVIRRAQKKDLKEISRETAELIALARSMRLRSTRQTGATFTLSSLGAAGIEAFNVILNPPQVAGLAVGAILSKPCVLAGEVVIRPRVRLTLTVDHRVIDGAMAAAFLSELKSEIESWEWPAGPGHEE